MANNQTVPQTRNNLDKISIVGHVTGVKRDTFFRSGVSKGGKKWNSLNFGIEISASHVIWVEMFGIESNDVFAYKPSERLGQKGETKKIPWGSRNNIPDGFRLIGATLNIGADSEGKKTTVVKTNYDACATLSNYLQDGMLVRVNGKIGFNTYESKDGKVTSIRYEINYLSSNVTLPEDMSDFRPATWSQNLIITGIDKPEDGDDRYEVSVVHVGYNSLSRSHVYTKNSILAKSINKELRNGQFACECYGDIVVVVDEPEECAVDSTDEWGDANPTTVGLTGSVERYLLMVGCDGANADHETYTEQDIKAISDILEASKQASNTFKNVDAIKPKKDDNWDDWGGDTNNTDDLGF